MDLLKSKLKLFGITNKVVCMCSEFLKFIIILAALFCYFWKRPLSA